MAISLEELKRQRDQIQKHLDWLDAKIAELAPQAEEKAPALEVPTPPKAEAPAEEVDEATPDELPFHRDESVPVVALEMTPSSYQAKTQSELMRAKVGCLVLFILSTALFLFLLFGLPYLL